MWTALLNNDYTKTTLWLDLNSNKHPQKLLKLVSHLNMRFKRVQNKELLFLDVVKEQKKGYWKRWCSEILSAFLVSLQNRVLLCPFPSKLCLTKYQAESIAPEMPVSADRGSLVVTFLTELEYGKVPL